MIRQAGQEQSHAGRDPSICTEPDCGSSLVYPRDWIKEGSGRWFLSLVCPECQVLTEGVFSKEQVERLDDRLERGNLSILRSLQEITRTNMLEEADLLDRALDADLIMPEDFTPRPNR